MKTFTQKELIKHVAALPSSVLQNIVVEIVQSLYEDPDGDYYTKEPDADLCMEAVGYIIDAVHPALPK